MIKTIYYDKSSIFIISIINFINCIILFISLFFDIFKNAIFIFVLLLILIIALFIIQILIFVFSYGKIIFSNDGITLYGKYANSYSWKNVVGIYFCDFIFIGDFNCIEIWIHINDYEDFELLSKEKLKIFCTKKCTKES